MTQAQAEYMVAEKESAFHVRKMKEAADAGDTTWADVHARLALAFNADALDAQKYLEGTKDD